MPQSATIILYTNVDQTELTTTMPNLTNKTVEEAKDAMNRAGLNIRIRGSGKVIKQGYPAGTKLKKGDVVDINFVEMVVD